MKRSLQLSNYWWCQLLGWGAVIPYWYFYESRGGLPFYLVLVSVCSQVALQIFVTDQYRRLVHRRQWLSLPLRKLLPVVFAAWVLLTAQYLLMAFVVFRLRYDHSYLADDTLLGALAGGTRYHAIWLLAFHLYHFARQSANQRTAAAEARLARLSNDLNPHFLFNALNGIKGLTREDPARARTAIDRLAGILRYALRRTGEPLVELDDELAIIREYLALEKIRFEERLTIEWSLPERTENIRLPPLSLHTLVENGVKHGIAEVARGGVLRISLHQKADGYTYVVSNPRSPKTFPRTGGPGPEPYSAGTGLDNLRQRLHLQFGTAAQLTVVPTADSFTATMTLPL